MRRRRNWCFTQSATKRLFHGKLNRCQRKNSVNLHCTGDHRPTRPPTEYNEKLSMIKYFELLNICTTPDLIFIIYFNHRNSHSCLIIFFAKHRELLNDKQPTLASSGGLPVSSFILKKTSYVINEAISFGKSICLSTGSLQ